MKRNTKRIFAALLALAAVLGLAGCGGTPSAQSAQSEAPAQSAASEPAQSEAETPAAPEETPAEAETGGALVVYFSRTGEQYTVGVIEHGNTAIVAEMIADAAGAELFEILPLEDHYPMTYAELTDVAKREQNENARPAYAGEIPDLSLYDTVFIGAPVWWGDWPMILYTFFEENAEALAGKRLVPFSTHEGSGLSGFDKKLAEACPNSTVLDGLAIRGNDAQNRQDDVRNAVSEWVADIM